MHLLVWSTGNPSSSPAWLILGGEWKTLAARTATARPCILLSRTRIPLPAKLQDKPGGMGSSVSDTPSPQAVFASVLFYSHTWLQCSALYGGKNHKTEATAKLLTRAAAFQGASLPSY